MTNNSTFAGENTNNGRSEFYLPVWAFNADNHYLKKMNAYKNIYFIGIGGIGMSALARWFHSNRYTVAGYDLTPSPLTQELENEGIAIHFEDDISQIPIEFLTHPAETLVIFTPAVPETHMELAFFREKEFAVKKRSEVLGLLTENLFTVAVAGTHGKTTTSSLMAHLLTFAGKNVTAFLGGITQNYGTNLLLNNGLLSDAIVVAEADEYDRSFLTLSPDIAVITSTDADHLDIYGSHEEVKKSFEDFTRRIKPGGTLFLRTGLPESLQKADNQIFKYSASKGGNFRAENIRTQNGQFIFDLITPEQTLKDLQLGIPGFHNVENATVASAVALQLGVGAETLRRGLADFRGVKRRFEWVLRTEKHIFIDDYAHHPAEIEAFLTSLRALFPHKKLTVIFQPHLFSRTRDFAPEFAQSLSLADELLLLDIYPAREKPMPGVTSQLILDLVTLPRKKIVSKNELLQHLENHPPEVLVTLGAGDIDRLVEPIRKLLDG
jgi:UDP-N-acetylmuramate--alanine ligase